jgi:hypothetical protein
MEKTSSLLVNHFYNGISTHVNDTNNIPICLGTTYHKPFEIEICYIFSKQLHLISAKINIHYEKKGILQLALQLTFSIALDICNSLYLNIMSANE